MTLHLTSRDIERGYLAPLREVAFEYLELTAKAHSAYSQADYSRKASELFDQVLGMEKILREVTRLEESNND